MEGFLERSFASGRDPGNGALRARALVRTYLYGSAFKLLSAERRKLGRDQPADLIAISSHDSDERLWVRQALDRLEAHDREILMLREYEPLS